MNARASTSPEIRSDEPGWPRRLLDSALSHKRASFGFVLLAAIILVSVVGPHLSSYSPFEQDVLRRLQGPSAAHWLGTDQFGRDILARLMTGAQLSIAIGFSATVLAMVLGSALGMAAAWRGRNVDTLIMQSMDALMAFPSLLLGLIIVAMLGPSVVNIVVAISVTSVPIFARVARAPTMAIKEREYIEACRALGYSDTRVLVGHVLPNMLPDVTVMGVMWLATAIRTEASLAFIGLGVRPPTPTWGGMIFDGFENLFEAPHLAIIPSIAILALVFSITLIGDGLRDLLDPKLRREI